MVKVIWRLSWARQAPIPVLLATVWATGARLLAKVGGDSTLSSSQWLLIVTLPAPQDVIICDIVLIPHYIGTSHTCKRPEANLQGGIIEAWGPPV